MKDNPPLADETGSCPFTLPCGSFFCEKNLKQMDLVNGFTVLSAELAYMGIKIKQQYVTKVTDGYALSCILSFTDDDQKVSLYEMVNSIKMK